MNGYACVADLGFYLRAIEHGLMVIIVLVWICSLMRDEPLFSF
ncbi:MAG: hypothetical protein METHP_01675 [Methanoregula sp. SKADARSKE-2]|nr:MAG: hypothetical protein METHP_01675 [Methanoregula sp. SKADARSKE-2]